VWVKNLLPINGRCLQSHYLATGLHAKILIYYTTPGFDGLAQVCPQEDMGFPGRNFIDVPEHERESSNIPIIRI
jgi:hypothetical protein